MQVEAGHVRGHIGMIMRTEDLRKLSLKSFKRKSWGFFAYTGVVLSYYTVGIGIVFLFNSNNLDREETLAPNR